MTKQELDSWFTEASTEQKPVLEKLRSLIMATGPAVVEEFRWSRPCYSNPAGLFCYLQRSKKHVTLGFHSGAELKDPDGLLEGEGSQMRHIKFSSVQQTKDLAVKNLIQQAARLS
jgi:hypothetical protein